MFIAAVLLAFARLVFLAVVVQAQGTTYSIVNPVSGLVFEDHDWAPLQVGNPITGSPYTGRPEQVWEVGIAPAFASRFRRDRLVGRQQIFIGDDGPPSATLSAQNVGDSFYLYTPFGTVNGIFAFVKFGTNLAITAPSVANGTLTLQPYNATDQYQHWVFFSSGTPAIGFSSGAKEESGSPKL